MASFDFSWLSVWISHNKVVIEVIITHIPCPFVTAVTIDKRNRHYSNGLHNAGQDPNVWIWLLRFFRCSYSFKFSIQACSAGTKRVISIQACLAGTKRVISIHIGLKGSKKFLKAGISSLQMTLYGSCNAFKWRTVLKYNSFVARINRVAFR